MPRSPQPPDLNELLDSWMIHLRAENKSPQTLETYQDGVRGFLAWCERTGRPAVLDRPTVNAFVADLLARGAQATTARARQLAVRRFSAWLADPDGGDELDRDELLGLRPPRLDQKITPRLTEDECRALLRACAGREFRDRRDEAIVRLMLETAARAGEVVAMTVTDIDQAHGLATVRRGKGGAGRTVPFGPHTGRALDRYLRQRRAHRLADTPALWLGDRGKGLRYDGLYRALTYRASLAGLPTFRPHLLRHTSAQRWLAAGGSETGLMAVAGWTRHDMLHRYTRSSASNRAAEEARKLNLGDL